MIKVLCFLGVCLLTLLLSGCSEPSGKKQDPLKALANSSGNFTLPSPEHEILFPQAHDPHKDYRQEWWYLTANLTTESGDSLATQWTLFRRAVEDKHWYFAHAALADAQQHQSSYRNARESLGNVMLSSNPFTATIDDWTWQSTQALLPATLQYGSSVGSISHHVDLVQSQQTKSEQGNEQQAATQQPWQVELNLTTKQPYFLQGDQGFSQKHATLNIASHYYSQPFIEVSGQVFWQGQWQNVTGNAWFDREWGSRMLAQDQQGWDWFSLRLTDETALMVYQLRSRQKNYIYASIMHQGGEIQTFTTDEVVVKSNDSLNSNNSNSSYPTRFSLEIAKENINLTVNVVNKNQIMRFGIEYFEGMVTFTGSHQGKGFLEMTGYNSH